MLLVSLAIYACIDLWQTDERRVRIMPRPAWTLIVVLIPLLGPLAWLLLGKGDGSASGGSRRHNRRPTGPVAPDDDPDFLWRMEQENRRRRARLEEERRRAQEGDSGADPEAPAERDATEPDADRPEDHRPD